MGKTFQSGIISRLVNGGGTYAVLNTETQIDVDSSNGLPTIVKLQPIDPANGHITVYINDYGNNCSVGTITVVASGGNLINGQPTLVLNTDGIGAEISISDQRNFIACLNNDTQTGGGTVTGADNGLGLLGANVELGGVLNKNTIVDGNGNYYLGLQNLTTFDVTTNSAGASTHSSANGGIVTTDIVNSNGSSLSVGYYSLGFFDGFSWSFNNQYQLTMSSIAGLLYDDLINGRLFRINHLTGQMELPRYNFSGAPTDRHVLGIDPNGNVYDIGVFTSNVYNGAQPTNTVWGNIPVGTNLVGKTFQEIIEMATIAYINPSFSSFSITGQAQTVEVGTIIVAPKTFTWVINQGSGVVTTLDLYDNTLATTMVAGTANDGSESVNIPSVNFTTQGQTQSYKGIGYNTQNNTTFNSNNFIITGSYLEFYGSTATNSVTSADVRALPNNRFSIAGNSFNMNTGTVDKIFEIVLPSSKTLTSVYDATAAFFITGSFVSGTINVNDASGNSVAYNIYRLTNAVPYSVNHVFNIVTT